jgi:hypothetical protein
MAEQDRTVLDAVVQSQVGRSAKYRVYDRSIRTPMNFVLDEAQRQFPREFVVYWVDGGLPEVFSISGVVPVAVFNSRFVEVDAFLRTLVVDTILPQPDEVAERICLRLMAELSLHYADVDQAVLALAQSLVGGSVTLLTSNSLADLEAAPIDEAYMAVWFFGLAHEIGHFVAAAAEVPASGPLSDAGIRAGINIGIDHMAGDRLDLTALREFARTQPLEHVRAEAHADLFAAGVLFQSTLDILGETGGEFRIDQFMAELVIAVNVVALFERCKQTVRLSARGGSSADILRFQYSTPAFFVRSSMVREYLRRAVASWLSDGPPSDTHLQAVDRLLDQVSQQLAERFNTVETGLARAMRFFLFPRERQPDVLDRLAAEVRSGDGGVAAVQLQDFLQTAAERGAHSASLEVLQALVHDERAGEPRHEQDARHPCAS